MVLSWTFDVSISSKIFLKIVGKLFIGLKIYKLFNFKLKIKIPKLKKIQFQKCGHLVFKDNRSRPFKN
jgi:hypothetical protein